MKKEIGSLIGFLAKLFNSIYNILMATRIKDWEVPYTWWIGIEITNNHVINVLLRELNNLIHVNEDRELYVDLQLDDWIEPWDDFPVGITTWRILQEDWWQQNGLIINWKTTSWDYTRLITAADGNLYVDLWDWVWRLLGWESSPIDCNVRRFIVTDLEGDETIWQQMVDWYLAWKYPIIVYRWESYILEARPQTRQIRFYWIHSVVVNEMNQWRSYVTRKNIYATWDENDEFMWWLEDEIIVSPIVLATNLDYQVPYVPLYDWSPATKKYVDDWLALKQDKLTAGQYITIDQNNVISALMPSALVYKWNVNGIADLPASWTVWDTYFVIWADAMYSWDWTQWNYVWWTWISLTDYFNKTVDDSDDITEGSVHLFCTSQEKAIWNAKQDALTAGTNIQISGNVISATDTTYIAWDWIAISNSNVISNTAKFDPENAGSLGQYLKKTSTGYTWANIPSSWWWTTYTAWDGINITGNVISATDRFTPTNTWSTGQVLKKSGANSYYWANESGWGGWGWNFNPENDGTVWQVLTKTATWYDWETIAGWEWNVKLFTLSSTSDTTTAQAVLDWTLAGKMPIIKLNFWVDDVYYWLNLNWTGPIKRLEFEAFLWEWQWNGYTYQTYSNIFINYSWTTVTDIVRQTNELNKSWIGTQTEFNNLWTYENWVVYNIIPS